MEKQVKKIFIIVLTSSIIVSSIFGGIMGFWVSTLNLGSGDFLGIFRNKTLNQQLPKSSKQNIETKNIVKVKEENAVILAVENVSPAVVSIIITKDLPIIERYYNNPFGGNFDFFESLFGDGINFGMPAYRQRGTEKKEIGGGTGFIVSSDGYIATNKHVVLDEEAEYTVLMNDGTKHEAKVLAIDPLTDLAVLKIEGEDFDFVELGDSSDLKVGQSVIAIGNALAEFRNTVSTGVVSGLSRSITAGVTGAQTEQLIGLIQTDASINPGNSGGPLLNLAGQVIGINTAMASGAENIGFAIPINEVKNTIENVEKNGRIVRPWLGVRYVMINEKIAELNDLEVDYGALLIRGESIMDLAVIPESPADKAGLKEGDIILEVDGKKIDEANSLLKNILSYQPDDKIKLKILRDGEEKIIDLKLEEMK